MARLGSIAPEPFSPADRIACAGLGSILRDPSILSGTNRANVLLGLSRSRPQSLSKSPVRSITSSPIESHLLQPDDSDELEEEDVWAADSRSWQETAKISDPNKPGLHGQSVKEDLGLGITDICKQKVNAAEALRPSRRRSGLDKGPGLTDALKNATGGAMGPSPLSRITENHGSISIHQQQTTSSRISTTASRMIPQLGASDSSSWRHVEHHQAHQSAPVKVPDWSKILGTGKKVSIMDDDEDGDDEEERLPPHELLAKQYARSQRTTFSVYEGQGRTLKGRDMSRVRNAVWRQSGFAD